MSTTETKTRPTHRIYAVMGGKEEKKVWQSIGAAWPNKDQKGFSLQYTALPLPGARIVLREIDSNEQVEE